MTQKRLTDDPHSSGFTLVELLVTIAIIGLLVGLLIPAVQMARESSRRTECGYRLRQLGLGVLQLEGAQRQLPSGGWGKKWAGLPGRGVSQRQPGGWIYQVLPYIEQASLFEIGGVDPRDEAENIRRLETPLPILHCPSRRSAKLYKNAISWKPVMVSRSIASVARNDYAINGGSVYIRPSPGPDSLEEASNYPWVDMKRSTGLCYQRSQVKLLEIADGLSNTYMLGEKQLSKDRYETGDDWGDNESAYGGDNRDLIRYTGLETENGMKPISDFTEYSVIHDSSGGKIFGSAHGNGFNMMMVDGSVRLVHYSIDQRIHSLYGSRSDRKIVSE